ncbi:lipoprotein insertase outer membrane protein LolB [Orbaceae bacterium ESL0721]|nr:lipoprotein insertase outer membrane protein LolB [Orbaceae bacterium ESL0721]
MKNPSIFNLKYIYLFILILFLYGCKSVLPEAQITEKWQQHQQELKGIKTFQVNGSIALINDRSKSYSRFLLSQFAPDSYKIRLTTPVGTTIATLTAQPNYAELIDRDGRRYSDQNVENLIFRLTKSNIPLKSLHNWLIGLSDNPNSDKLDSLGRLVSTEFIEDNNRWDLKIVSYKSRSYDNGQRELDLPSIIELTNKDQHVRLKIDKWLIP